MKNQLIRRCPGGMYENVRLVKISHGNEHTFYYTIDTLLSKTYTTLIQSAWKIRFLGVFGRYAAPDAIKGKLHLHGYANFTQCAKLGTIDWQVATRNTFYRYVLRSTNE
jgi:hypothetical protein